MQHLLQQHPETRDCRAANLKDALYFFSSKKNALKRGEGGQGAPARTVSRQTNRIVMSGLVDSYLVQTIPCLTTPSPPTHFLFLCCLGLFVCPQLTYRHKDA